MARLCIVFGLLWATVTYGQSLGQLSGTVSDDSGSPIVGANVVLEGAALAEGKTGVSSDEGGRFVLTDIPAGTYVLRITHIGFSELVLADVSVDGESEVELVMSDEVIFIDQSVVSASRRQEKILDAPASVSVIDAEDIRTQPVSTVAEHIRDLPAVDFAQTGLAQANVVARGFNNIFSGAMLTLTDNRIARVPSLRLNAYNFIPVTNDDIERIELVLGPGSALYGPNSANGVMHIITRSPLDRQGTNVNVGLGERSVRRFSARHAGKIGENLGYKLSLQSFSGTDWEYVDPEEIELRDYDLSRNSTELRIDYRPNDDLMAIVSTGYNSADNIELTGLGAGLADGWVSGYYQARVMYKDLFFQAFQNWTDAGDTFLLRSGGPIRDKSKLTVLQLQHFYNMGVRQRFTYGADILLTRPDTEGTINGANENDDDINEFGLYLQSETSIADKLELVLAARYDDHNRIPDAELSPRAAIVFKPTDTQTLRFTYNSAFSTPSSNNLYLDLVSSPDAFNTGALFEPSFGFKPSFDVRAQGTYRKGFDGGFSFVRSANGRPQFRSPFAPLAGAPSDQYWELNDPLFTNVMWSIGRGATLAQVTPVFTGLVAGQLQAAGLDAATAQAQAGALAQALPSLIPEQLAGLNNSLMSLNLETSSFDPVADAYDVPFTRSTNTHTFEIGYKGVLGNKLVVAADAYRTTTENFVGPLGVETPNVFLEPTSLAAALGPGIAAAMADPANAQVAEAVTALDAVQLPGVVEGNGNGTAVDEVTALFVGGAAGIPYGTVSPEQAYDPTALLLAYRNFGKVTTSGIDLNLAYYASDALMLSGGMAYIDNNFFENVDGIADIALNAPKLKLKMGAQYALQDMGLRFGAQVRYSGSFRQSSGVYVGDVDAYSVLDLNVGYQLPIEQNMRLTLDVSNALNNEHIEFVGAPMIGRLAVMQLSAAF